MVHWGPNENRKFLRLYITYISSVMNYDGCIVYASAKGTLLNKFNFIHQALRISTEALGASPITSLHTTLMLLCTSPSSSQLPYSYARVLPATL